MKISGKISLKHVFFTCFFCLTVLHTHAQPNNAESVFTQAEEHLAAKKYDDALSKLALYENMSAASKEKAQVLKIQIYRERALKDPSQTENYNNEVEVLKNMFADGKKVKSEDLYRILKEQQEFNDDVKSQSNQAVSVTASDINIDGIKIGMNVEEIPGPAAVNFDWSKGYKGPVSDQLNYVPLFYVALKYERTGIQTITADDRTRRVLEVFKTTETGKYKEKDKSGVSKYNAMVEALKAKHGEAALTIIPKQVMTQKLMNREMDIETYSTVINSQSVIYTLTYTIVNGTYSIMELIRHPDYIKN